MLLIMFKTTINSIALFILPPVSLLCSRVIFSPAVHRRQVAQAAKIQGITVATAGA